MSNKHTIKRLTRPIALFFIILGSIAAVEFVVMSFLSHMPEMSVLDSALFDVGVLSVTIAPILYLFLFKPLQRQAKSLKEANQKISQQQAAIERAQELGHIGTWEFDFKNKRVTGTNETCRIIGTPSGQLCSFDTFMEVLHPDEKERLQKAWEGLRAGKPFDIEFRIQVGEQLKWVRKKAEVRLSDNGEPLRAIGFLQDVTELKSLQEKAIRTAQLASVGELSTMVAHEVNNPLSGVMGYAQVLINRGGEENKDKELLSRILKEGERISMIVGRLLNFSYDSKGERSFQALMPIVVDAVGLMTNQLDRHEVRLDVELPEGLPPIRCNPQQVEQVILNILRNAFQAVVESPPSKESERIIHVHAATVEVHGRIEVRLTLANNGPPIPKGLMERIREPFFTTKPVGTGTGLGLSISSDIMKAHGGRLDILSEPGEFTQMILCFPAAMGEMPANQ